MRGRHDGKLWKSVMGHRLMWEFVDPQRERGSHKAGRRAAPRLEASGVGQAWGREQPVRALGL